MTENKINIFQSAMRAGTVLGVFWIFKYLFFILGFQSQFFGFIYWFLAPVTLVITYILTHRYRIRQGGKIKFFTAWQYGVLLYFFAALIVALPHYIFYAYIAPPDLLASSMEMVIQMLEKSNWSQETKDAIENMAIPTPIGMAIRQIFNNIFYGMIFSVPIGIIVSRATETSPGDHLED